MTFYYYKELDGNKVKHKVTIDTEKINNIYINNFKKHANKRFVNFLSPSKVQINNADIIVTSYTATKIDENYEISYIMYNYPKICQIIDGLLCADTFASSYTELFDLAVSTRQEKIEIARRIIDREIRKFNIMLDVNNTQFNELYRNVNMQINKIRRLSDFDLELAQQAQLVMDSISIQKVDEKDDYKYSFQKKKVKMEEKN